jgi:hypothetical protein
MPQLVKQYISRSDGMSKVIVSIGWNNEFVMDADKALTLLELLKDAEKYQEVYRSSDKGGSTYHIFNQDKELCNLKVLSSNFYNLARLAGKPEEK